MSKPAQKFVYTIAEAAELLDVSDDTIYREIKRGHLAATRVGKKGQRILWDAIETYLRARTSTVAANDGGYTSTTTPEFRYTPRTVPRRSDDSLTPSKRPTLRERLGIGKARSRST